MATGNYFFDTRVESPRQRLAEVLASPNVAGASGPGVVSSAGAVRAGQGGATLGEGFAALVQNFMNASRQSRALKEEEKLREETIAARKTWLESKGVSPEQAALFAMDGTTFGTVAEELTKAKPEPKTYEVDGKILRDDGKGGVVEVYGGTPKDPKTEKIGDDLYQKDENGNWVKVIEGPSDFEELHSAYEKAVESGKFTGTLEDFSKLFGKGGTTVNVGEKLTEGQSKDLYFYNAGTYAQEKLTPELEKALQEAGSIIMDGVPMFGNAGVSKEYQQAKAYGKAFLAAILRKESGGAITEDEWNSYGPTYLPQYGDDEETLAMKRVLRKQALDGIKIGLGTAGDIGDKIDEKNAPKDTPKDSPQAESGDKVYKFNPDTGRLE